MIPRLTDRVASATERTIEVLDGHEIVREGEAGEEMYLVQSGAVTISKRVDGREVVLGEVGPGDFFGEMSLLESLPREATARANGTTRLLVLGPGALLVRLRRDPSLAVEMLHRLSGRLRRLNARLGTDADFTDDMGLGA
ncbi:MAG: cyclic nucleotide-binding domain-containing protein [Nitriliruptorales bacterium]|nr:cyclic nucleotide-binding domain-containing protein [Nitriliruptorales bacterium]